ncbi:MAG: type III-B CRISPR-associated protein Cas10/Cmr2 [Gemmatales bacterium]|nr:type III-B CRISPR-associated protein Cas10/Cmr2 [Gemmatales bacterium]MDW8174944.1 type III-B CRISPR-associated protein Cas10/Cmr2 [Gemmatales bacterium]
MAEFAPDDRVCLLMRDTDAIKNYVFETSTLPEIRGGSEILIELEQAIGDLLQVAQERGPAPEPRRSRLQEWVHNTVRPSFIHDVQGIYCGGGGFLAIVRENRAEELKQLMERLYLDHTTTATITVVCSEPVPYRDLEKGLPLPAPLALAQLRGRGIAEELLASHFNPFVSQREERKNFGEWLAYLVAQLQQAKRQKTLVPFIETLPVYRRCDSCGKRPSGKYDHTRGEEICTICWQKRERGRTKRRGYLLDLQDWLREQFRLEVEIEPAESFGEMVGSQGRLAVIYADGNNMGELLQRARTIHDYHLLSTSLRQATRDALFQALFDVLIQGKWRWRAAPFEIIAIGGDDVIVVVPYRAAWDVARELIRRFEEHSAIRQLQEQFSPGSRRDRKPTMSAGVAIADVKYPIGFLIDLAEDLLKEAKRWARATEMGTLCHLWLRSPVISNSARVTMKSLYEKQTGPAKLLLTSRPYTWHEAEQLSQLATSLQSIPKSQRRALAECLEKGPLVSINYALYQATRHPHLQLQKLFGEVRDLILHGRKNGKANTNWFWVESSTPKGSYWETALLDALELADLGTKELRSASYGT